MRDDHHYREMDRVFPNHELFLEVSIGAEEVWKALAFCSSVFDRDDVELIKMSGLGNSAVFFRLNCQSHTTIQSLRDGFDCNPEVEVTQWMSEIRGLREDRFTKAKSKI